MEQRREAPAWRRTRWWWTSAAITTAVLLFFAATNDEVYDLTSPPQLSWHVVLRKAYSIVAFAVVGFTADKALGPSDWRALRAAILVAVYSGAIEIAQAVHGSHEGATWNIIDVLCGAVGGWVAIVVMRLVRRDEGRFG